MLGLLLALLLASGAGWVNEVFLVVIVSKEWVEASGGSLVCDWGVLAAETLGSGLGVGALGWGDVGASVEELGVEEVVWDDQARGVVGQGEESSVVAEDDVDASELDDFVLLEDRGSLEEQGVLLSVVVDEVDELLLWRDGGGLKHEVDLWAGVLVLDGGVLVCWFSKVRGPGDGSQGVGSEEVEGPVTDLGDSLLLIFGDLSAVVLWHVSGAAVGDLGSLLARVD